MDVIFELECVQAARSANQLALDKSKIGRRRRTISARSVLSYHAISLGSRNQCKMSASPRLSWAVGIHSCGRHAWSARVARLSSVGEVPNRLPQEP